MTATLPAAYTPPTGGLPQPGDWFVVDPREALFDRIEWAEGLAEWAEHHRDPAWRAGHRQPGWYRWGHAGVATRWVTPPIGHHRLLTDRDRILMIAEAEPGGAVEVPWHWENNPHMWSTGTGLSVPGMGPAARRYTQRGPWGDHGVPYSFVDYAVIAAAAVGMRTTGVTTRLAAIWHMICSQLTDQSAVDRGVHLFDDGRPPGLVTPLDLGMLLASKGVAARG